MSGASVAPVISVGMPVYNGAAHLAKALYDKLNASPMQPDGAPELFGDAAPRPVAPPGQTS